MKKQASYQIAGYTYQYGVKGQQVDKASGRLVSLQLRNIDTKAMAVIGEMSNPAMFEKAQVQLQEHFNYSTSIKLDLILLLNEVVISFEMEPNKEEVARYQPKDSQVSIAVRPKNPSHEEWLEICRLSELDHLGITRDTTR